jgi:hypothetical protein
MRKGFLAVAVLASAVLFACPKQKPVPELASESDGAGTQGLLGGPKLPGCAMGCQDSGTGCTIYVETTSKGGQKFKPSPDEGWQMCPGQTFVLESQTDKAACVDLRGMDGGSVAAGSLEGRALWSSPSLQMGTYCVSVCWDKDKNDAGCSAGCKHNDCRQGGPEDTIRGNLDVVVKDPEPRPSPRDAGTP